MQVEILKGFCLQSKARGHLPRECPRVLTPSLDWDTLVIRLASTPSSAHVVGAVGISSIPPPPSALGRALNRCGHLEFK